MKDTYKIYEQWYKKNNRQGHYEDEILVFAQLLLDELESFVSYNYYDTTTSGDVSFDEYFSDVLENL